MSIQTRAQAKARPRPLVSVKVNQYSFDCKGPKKPSGRSSNLIAWLKVMVHSPLGGGHRRVGSSKILRISGSLAYFFPFTAASLHFCKMSQYRQDPIPPQPERISQPWHGITSHAFWLALLRTAWRTSISISSLSAGKSSFTSTVTLK